MTLPLKDGEGEMSRLRHMVCPKLLGNQSLMRIVC